MLPIPTEWKVNLSKQPEYGMGYQKGTVRLSNGKQETGFILNGSIFANENELKTLTAADMKTEESRLSTAIRTPVHIVEVNLIPRHPDTLRGVRLVQINAKGSVIEASNETRASRAAKDGPSAVTIRGEVFRRFSAYEKDFRVTEKQGLQPGTFGTTAEDAESVKTGREAIARYALENKQSANKRFTIKPMENTVIQSGIVEPAYGEPGGGVEVIFVNGTGDGTVTGPVTIPE